MLDHLALLSIEKSINNTQWEGKQTFLRRLEVGEFGLCHFFVWSRDFGAPRTCAAPSS